jgi:shikimate dehydrogenase
MSEPILAGVIGWPIGHSRSPLLHGHWLARYGVRGHYVPLAVPPKRLETALRALPSLGFAGVNVTIPHKQAAARLVDRLDAAAERTGSVNMITVAADGTLDGASTDGAGFCASLDAAVPGVLHRPGPVLMLGAGGAARAIGDALQRRGAELLVVNRTREHAQSLATLLGPAVTVVDWSDLGDALAGIRLLVNTTALGMIGKPPLALDLTPLSGDAVVADIVYTPLETNLLAAARARGNPVVDGLGMLLHQARPAFQRWFGIDPGVDAALRAAVLTDPAGAAR